MRSTHSIVTHICGERNFLCLVMGTKMAPRLILKYISRNEISFIEFQPSMPGKAG